MLVLLHIVLFFFPLQGKQVGFRLHSLVDLPTFYKVQMGSERIPWEMDLVLGYEGMLQNKKYATEQDSLRREERHTLTSQIWMFSCRLAGGTLETLMRWGDGKSRPFGAGASG